MRLCLMRDDQTAAKLTIEFGSMASVLTGAEIVEPALLPPGIWIPMRADRTLDLRTAAAYC